MDKIRSRSSSSADASATVPTAHHTDYTDRSISSIKTNTYMRKGFVSLASTASVAGHTWGSPYNSDLEIPGFYADTLSEPQVHTHPRLVGYKVSGVCSVKIFDLTRTTGTGTGGRGSGEVVVEHPVTCYDHLGRTHMFIYKQLLVFPPVQTTSASQSSLAAGTDETAGDIHAMVS